jgi:hypothetical protein
MRLFQPGVSAHARPFSEGRANYFLDKYNPLSPCCLQNMQATPLMAEIVQIARSTLCGHCIVHDPKAKRRS